MNQSPPLLQEVIEHFKKLPGVGEKTARRLAFAILDMDKGEVRNFAEALRRVREETGYCKRCGNLAEGDICPICSDREEPKECYASLNGLPTFTFLKDRDISGAATMFYTEFFHHLMEWDQSS